MTDQELQDKLRAEIQELRTKNDELEALLRKILNDHEPRIQALEKRSSPLFGF
jgi:predicted component of type VI protein secretion system